jgi:hypothetical protein
MEMRGKEYTVEDLVAIAPAHYLELHDQYDHSQGDPYRGMRCSARTFSDWLRGGNTNRLYTPTSNKNRS